MAIKLTLPDQMVHVIIDALRKHPWEPANPVMMELHRQVNAPAAQRQPKSPAKPAPTPAKPKPQGSS